MTAKQGELVPIERAVAAPMAASATPAELLRLAVQGGADVDRLEKLVGLQERWEGEQARKAFFAAVVGFQQEVPIVETLDNNNGRPYAKLSRIWQKVQPTMAKHGLGVVWTGFRIDGEMCHLEGKLTHAAGFALDLVRDIPMPEELRGQNKCQRAGSADSYAKRYAVCDALGIITGKDDDGAGGVECITEAQGKELTRLCLASGRKIESVLAMAGVSDLTHYPVAAYENVCKMLTGAAKAKVSA